MNNKTNGIRLVTKSFNVASLKTRDHFYKLSLKGSLRVTRKPKVCSIYPHLIRFYEKIIKNQEGSIKNILNSKVFSQLPNFVNTISQVNSGILKNTEIEMKSTKLLNTLDIAIKDKETTLGYLEYAADRVASYEMTNEEFHLVVGAIKKKFLFFSEEEREKIATFMIDIYTKFPKAILHEDALFFYQYSKKPTKEESSSEDESEEMKLSRSNLQDLSLTRKEPNLINLLEFKNIEKFKVSFNESREVINITSNNFFPKLRIIGVNDYQDHETVVDNLLRIDKEMPNVIHLPIRPLFNLNNSGIYTSFLNKENIFWYKDLVLGDKSNFQINSNECFVYERRDNLKKISLYNTLLLSQSERIRKYNDIKVILSSIPIYKEVERMLEAFDDESLASEFFQYLKLTNLFEKYFWATGESGGECPACSKKYIMNIKNLPELVDLDDLGFSSKLDSYADQVVKSIINFSNEPYIYCFIEDKNAFKLLDRLLLKLDVFNTSAKLDFKNKSFLSYEFPNGNFYDYYNNTYLTKVNKDFVDKLENKEQSNTSESNTSKAKISFLNKLALASSIYAKTSERIPEIDNIHAEFSVIRKYIEKYYEKLNLYDELQIWEERKYDYKCYPNYILINQFKKELTKISNK